MCPLFRRGHIPCHIPAIHTTPVSKVSLIHEHHYSLSLNLTIIVISVLSSPGKRELMVRYISAATFSADRGSFNELFL